MTTANTNGETASSAPADQIRFRKTPFGDFIMGEVLFFYDAPLVFFISDQNSELWIANALADNIEARTSDWALSKLQEGDKEKLLPGAKNRVDEVNFVTRRSSHLLRECWDSNECIEMHPMTAEEINAAYAIPTTAP